MYNITLLSFINRILQTYYRIGLWDEKAGVIGIALKLFHIVYVVSFFASVAAGAYVINNKNESIFLLAISSGLFVISFRVYKLIVGKTSIIAFLQDLSSHSTDDYDEFVRIDIKLKAFVKLCLWFIVLFAFAFAFASDLVVPVVLREKTSFWIAYFFMAGGLTYAIFSLLFAIIICYLMLNCTIRYEMLGSQLRNLGEINIDDEIEGRRSKDEAQKLFLLQLIEAIENYRSVNRTVDEFSKFFENLFFIQMSTSGMCICGAIYSLTFNSDSNMIYAAVFFGFIIYSLFDIFVVMFLGNNLKESSDRLSYCLFESNWMDQSRDCKRHILIIFEVLRKPQEILISKLYPLNLQTFTSILKGAYSMFNLLTSLK